MDWRERLAEHWKDRGLFPIIPPASDTDIQTFERLHSVEMPLQIRLYFQWSNGMNSQPGKDLDENGFRFMPLSEVCSVRDFAAEKSWKLDPGGVDLSKAFVFVDYLQWCGAYAFESGKVNRGAIYLLGSPRVTIVSFSLEQFIDLYLKDSVAIYQR
jgi:hypothetical protein